MTIPKVALVKGLHKAGRQDRLRAFLGKLPSLEFLTLDERASELAGRIYADLESSGQIIGRADPMIAGIALRHDLTLVSGNEAHYERIRSHGYNLKLANWKKM